MRDVLLVPLNWKEFKDKGEMILEEYHLNIQRKYSLLNTKHKHTKDG